MWVRR
jgi:hypothetical protein